MPVMDHICIPHTLFSKQGPKVSFLKLVKVNPNPPGSTWVNSDARNNKLILKVYMMFKAIFNLSPDKMRKTEATKRFIATPLYRPWSRLAIYHKLSSNLIFYAKNVQKCKCLLFGVESWFLLRKFACKISEPQDNNFLRYLEYTQMW
jgi:hypothetical protein